MATKTDPLLDLLRLPPKERARLARGLLVSLQPAGVKAEPEQLAREWVAEIERRTREVLAGTAKAVPWSETKVRLHKKLTRSSKRR